MVDQPFPEEGGDAASYRHIRNVCKALRSLVDPFLLPEKAFIKKFRLSKPLVRELIEDLTPFIAFGGHGGAVSVETKVFAARGVGVEVEVEVDMEVNLNSTEARQQRSRTESRSCSPLGQSSPTFNNTNRFRGSPTLTSPQPSTSQSSNDLQEIKNLLEGIVRTLEANTKQIEELKAKQAFKLQVIQLDTDSVAGSQAAGGLADTLDFPEIDTDDNTLF